MVGRYLMIVVTVTDIETEQQQHDLFPAITLEQASRLPAQPPLPGDKLSFFGKLYDILDQWLS